MAFKQVGECLPPHIRKLAEADYADVERKVLANASPTKPGNVRCMDCRCHGVGCPGMPPGYEQRLIEEW